MFYFLLKIVAKLKSALVVDLILFNIRFCTPYNWTGIGEGGDVIFWPRNVSPFRCLGLCDTSHIVDAATDTKPDKILSLSICCPEKNPLARHAMRYHITKRQPIVVGVDQTATDCCRRRLRWLPGQSPPLACLRSSLVAWRGCVCDNMSAEDPWSVVARTVASAIPLSP